MSPGVGASPSTALTAQHQRPHVKEENRFLDVEWDSITDSYYPVDIEITGFDRRGFLNEILQTINDSRTNISAISGRTERDKMTVIHMTIYIHSLEHLRHVVDKIKNIRDIYTVRRITK